MAGRRTITAVSITALLLSLVILWNIFSGITDVRRDFVRNEARLDERSSDPLLRPLEMAVSPAESARFISDRLTARPRWRLEAQETDDDGTVHLHLTHRTRLLRFVDDVHVRLVPVDDGTRMEAESRSRVGKGDLGQNPRNLRELVMVIQGDVAPE